jgi:glycosyltransferase involved in cell wall biosynthesis
VYCYSLANGGAEKVAVTLTESFDNNKYDVLLACDTKSPVAKASTTVRTTFLEARTPRQRRDRLAGLYQEFRPDIVLSHDTPENIAAVQARTLADLRMPIICVEHTVLSDLTPLFRSANALDFYRRMITQCYARADMIVCPVAAVAMDPYLSSNQQSGKLRVIHNPVITPAMADRHDGNLGNAWLDEDEFVVVLGVGRFSREKRFDDLVRAFRVVHSAIPESRLIFLGHGSGRRSLAATAEELGIAHVVDIVDFTMNPYSHINRSDVVVCTSQTESLPNVLVEALYGGTKAVSTSCSAGVVQLAEMSQNLPLAKVGDTDEIARLIIQAVRAREAEPPSRNFLRVFEARYATCQYENLIDQMLQNYSQQTIVHRQPG